VTFISTALLGSVAGFTIYLGLPVARLQSLTKTWRTFLNALAVGILVFLLFDVISKASEPITAAIGPAKTGDSGYFLLLVALFVVGVGGGLLSLVYFDRLFIRSKTRVAKLAEPTPIQLAFMIATGIGFHNFSEGLAIGQAAGRGALAFATILIIGFGLHNATEGFGVAAPIASDETATRPSWKLLLVLGLIAGGPTFLGTLVGYSLYSEPVFVLFLALAAGSILYVIAELINVGRKIGLREVAMWGIFAGFAIAYATDLILTWGGA